ncbi:hypothetical protein EON83_29540 [bacterium]|nr:MAG: hypothetical protein EON83_29540 [bacterium]
MAATPFSYADPTSHMTGITPAQTTPPADKTYVSPGVTTTLAGEGTITASVSYSVMFAPHSAGEPMFVVKWISAIREVLVLSRKRFHIVQVPIKDRVDNLIEVNHAIYTSVSVCLEPQKAFTPLRHQTIL